MKINTNILRDFVKVPKNLYEITNNYIVEVDSQNKGIIASKLVVGRVLSVNPHENSDHLNITKVDVGKNKPLQIVCGASNVKANQLVIVALVGAVLPGGFKISSTKVRGVESNGMICSLVELGLPKEHLTAIESNGIFVLSDDAKVGTNPLDFLGLSGNILELDLTPNRSDLLSHQGFAYDLAAVLNLKIADHIPQVVETTSLNDYNIELQSDYCFEYNLRYIEQVTIKPSPLWLRAQLIFAGIRPVNNVVDISNFILIKYGTPLHMFDKDKVSGKTIIVKLANNEEVITLDDHKVQLNDNDIVITDDEKVIAIAGVMGLKNSMIDNNTRAVLIEAALFNPGSIKGTSRRLNLISDSSLRFERGISQEQIIKSLEIATEMLVDLAGAKISKNIIRKVTKDTSNSKIRVQRQDFEQTGVKLSKRRLESYFKRLNYQFSYQENDKSYLLTIPSYRMDIQIPADVIEEITRIYGYNKIPNINLTNANITALSTSQRQIRRLRHHLASLGLSEVINYSLVSKEEVFQFDNLGNPLEILMPISDDRKMMRQSLINGIFTTIKYNAARKQPNISIFEIGNVYMKDQEILRLAAAMTGQFQGSLWQKNRLAVDYYLLKGILENISKELKVDLLVAPTDQYVNLHPKRQGNILLDNQVIGKIGEIHPKMIRDHDLDVTVVFELDLKKLLDRELNIIVNSVSKYPEVTRDIAIVVSNTVPISDIITLIEQTTRKNLVRVELFDVYQNDELGIDKLSLAFKLTLVDHEKTMTSEDVEKIMKSLMNRLKYNFDAKMRI